MIPRFDPRSWATGGDWSLEAPQEALNRLPDFGQEFFRRLFAEFPSLRGEGVFLRWSSQPDDVYAVFDRSAGGLCIQIDPDLGYIIVIASSGSGEHGDWVGDDRVQEALDHVRSLLGGAG
jgi:hypothetical protein